MIAVIAAMDQEVTAIVDILEHPQTVQISGVSFVQGTLCNHEMVVMKSGVGKGNASMATTILLERYAIDRVVNIGTAGGLCQEQNVLDAVISNRVVQHDFDTSPLDGAEGIGLYFEADSDLADICELALQHMQVKAHRGLIASGDQFIAQEEQLQRLQACFPDAMCAEMEAGAIAQVCVHYQIPFVVLRSLSDIAHKQDSHMDFVAYVVEASKRSAQFCKALMQLLA